MAWMWLLVFCAFVNSVRSQTTGPTVTTSKGAVVGALLTSKAETTFTYWSFLGIPYGAKPVRFQLPQERAAWTTALQAQADGPACPQPISTTITTSEDCLFLNVITPKDTTTASKLPVMVFIHGSGFTSGSSLSTQFGADFLVKQGVIFVAMNYRLGAAGFLTMGNKDAPGNLGLHDTRLALQWVQKEITNFGGDPTKVTLFGQSAGGIMVHHHYMSPLSAGLFSKAISESGSPMMDSGRVKVGEAVKRATLLARAVGCETVGDSAATLTCLQQVDIKYIVGNQSVPLSDQLVISGNDLRFVPVLEDYTYSDKFFFNETVDSMMKGAVQRAVPLIVGFNADEGFVRFREEAAWTRAEDNLGYFIPLDVLASATDAKKTDLTTKIRNAYFQNVTTQKAKIQALVKLYTDTSFAYPSVKISRYYASLAYGYVFAYKGSWATTPYFFDQYSITGVNHGDELGYLFYGAASGTQDLSATAANQPNLNMKDKMVLMWTTFAKTGVPADTWKTISAGGYMVIDSTTTTMTIANFENQYFTFLSGVEFGVITSSALASGASFGLLASLLTVFSVITNL